MDAEDIWGGLIKRSRGALRVLDGGGSRSSLAHSGPPRGWPGASSRGELLRQKDSFLCTAQGVSIGIAFSKRIGAGLLGAMASSWSASPGTACASSTGAGHRRLVAPPPSVSHDVPFVGQVETVLFGGEGIFFAFAALTGPGKVRLPSLPYSRLADRIDRADPQTGGSRTEEGSILDAAVGIGRLIDGR